MTRQYEKRYTRIQEKMDMLSITDVSTPRQCKNGTIEWQLPIKYGKDRFIRVASFKTGYVRNQNGGYTNYQLNKRCESEPQYYPVFEWCDKADDYIKTDKFRQYTTRSCVLIPNEIDRLEYLIGYCLKNYYIKKANEVVNGDYVHKWQLEHAVSSSSNDFNGHRDRINELEEKLDAMTEDRDNKSDRIYKLESQVDITWDKLVNSKDYTTDLKAQINMLQDKLKSVIRTARH